MNVEKFLREDFVNEGEWYDFKGGVKVKIKNLTPKENDALLKKATTKFASGNVKIDNKLFSILRKQEVVVDWEGFTSKGKSLPRTSENVTFLMDNCAEFADFVNDILVSDNEEEQKN